MGTELRVHKHCSDGDHENEHEQAVTCDLVARARTVCDHREGLDDVHVRMGSEEEVSTATSEAVTPEPSLESAKTPVGYGPEGTQTRRPPGPGGI